MSNKRSSGPPVPPPIEAISIPAAVNPMVPKPSDQVTGSVRGKEKKKKSTSLRNVRNNNTEPVTAFEEMKQRERSKSPLRRLMRTLSRSPLRRRKKDNDVHAENDPEGDSASFYNPSAFQGDCVSSLGTADYMQNTEFMVDPLGSVRSANHSQTQRRGMRASRRDGLASRSMSSSNASRSDSMYDDSETSNSSWRESRENDSLATGSRDSSRGSKQHERPRPLKVSKRRMIQERSPTPNKRSSPQALPSVREDDASTQEDAVRSERKQDPTECHPNNRMVLRRPRKVENSQVVWTKYPSPAKPAERKSHSSMPNVYQPSSSSLCSESTCLSTRVLLLLLHPVSKFFELIQLVFTPETSTLGDLLDSIPSQATEAKLVEQRYIGLVRAVKHAEAWTQRAQPASHMYTKSFKIPPAGIVAGDVLLAIPYGYTRKHVLRLGRQILESPRIKSMLVDRFRAENVPETITTVPQSRLPAPESASNAESEAKGAAAPTDSQSAMGRLLANQESGPPTMSDRKRRIADRPKTPPTSRFWSQAAKPVTPSKSSSDAATEEQRSVKPVSSRRIMSWDTMPNTAANEDSSSWVEDKSNSEVDPANQEIIIAEKKSLAPAEQSSKEETGGEHVLSRSLMASVSVDREDSSSWEDKSVSGPGPSILECVVPCADVRGMTSAVDDASDDGGNRCDSSETLDAPHAKCETAEPIQDQEGPPTSSAKLSTENGEPTPATQSADSKDEDIFDAAERDDSAELRQSSAGASPVRQRIVELEERIASCPGVPVPPIGPHDFNHSKSADESEDVPGLVETAHAEKYDSEDSDEACHQEQDHDYGDRDLSQNYEDAIADEILMENTAPDIDVVQPDIPAADLMGSIDTDEHREIVREALAHVESTPTSSSPSLELVVKGTLLDHKSDDDDEEDDATVVTNNTAHSRTPLALAGNYEDVSIDTNYSSWSHSVDSSLLSRYSLISHSNKSLMSDEDTRLAEERAKTRQRRRQKAKLARSVRKLGVSAVALMVSLYLIDPRRRSRTNAEESAGFGAVDSPLGFFGILQFVIAMSVLMKAQLLWKNSTEMKSGTCPFMKAASVFIESLKEKMS